MAKVLLASPFMVDWLKLDGCKLPESDDIYEETAWMLLQRRKVKITPQLLQQTRANVKEALTKYRIKRVEGK